MSVAFDAVLGLLLLLCAWQVVAARAVREAATTFIAFGLLLGLVWVRLGSVDIALTEVAVGGGLTTIVLLRAVSQLAAAGLASEDSHSSPPRFRPGVAALCAGVTAALAGVLLALPEPPPSLAPQVAANMAATGVGNPIAGVLMVFRAMDTVLETVVVLLALLGVWALAPARALSEPPAPLLAGTPPDPLAFLARVLVPVGLVVGTWQVWAGADIPGGKFQGAAVLAAMALLLMMAGTLRVPPADHRGLRIALLVGPLVFLGIGAAGWPLAGAFLRYPAGLEKPAIILVEIASTVSIAAALVLLVLGAPTGARR